MRMSSRSLSVSAPADRPPPSLLSPFMSVSSPPIVTRVCTFVPSTFVTSSAIRPSFRSSVSPRLHVPRQRLVGDADDLVGPGGRIECRVEHEGFAVHERGLARGKALDTDLGPAQVAQDADHAADSRRSGAYASDAPGVVVEDSVREVHPNEVRAGRDQVGERAVGVGRRPERRHDLGASWHVRLAFRCAQPDARSSSIATAGSVLPSTNSRKAPPPVEI